MDARPGIRMKMDGIQLCTRKWFFPSGQRISQIASWLIVFSSVAHKPNSLCGVCFRGTAIGQLRIRQTGFADSGSRGS